MFPGRRTALPWHSDRPARYQDSQFGVRSCNWPSSSSSAKLLLPTMLICWMRARLPSWMSIATLTLLPGTSSALASTAHRVLAAREILLGEVAPTSSSTDWSKLLPLASPMLRSDFSRSSVLMSLLPFTSKLSMVGRSSTATTSTLPSRRSSTSRKNPVAYSDFTASRDAPPIELVADVDRQVVEDRAFGDALQSLDPNVADHEVVACVARGRSVCCFLRIGAEHERTCDDDRDRRKDSAHRTLDARGMWSVAAFSEYFSRRRARCESSPHCECAVNGARFHALNSRRRSTRSITQALQLVALSVRVLGLSTDSDRPRAGTCRGRCG